MEEHYFTADPATPFKRVPVRANVWGHWLELTSGSGVFAQGRLDIGTGVLLREAAPPEEAREVLDLGCGYGVIGLAIAVAVPEARVTAVDVNERALLLARENAERLGVADRFTARAARRGRPRGGVRRDLVEPADQGRQGRPPRAAAPVAAPAAPGRPSADGGRQEPRLGLAGRLAGGAGLPDREAGQRQGIPRPGVRGEPAPSVDQPQRLQRAGATARRACSLERRSRWRPSGESRWSCASRRAGRTRARRLGGS